MCNTFILTSCILVRKKNVTLGFNGTNYLPAVFLLRGASTASREVCVLVWISFSLTRVRSSCIGRTVFVGISICGPATGEGILVGPPGIFLERDYVHGYVAISVMLETLVKFLFTKLGALII